MTKKTEHGTFKELEKKDNGEKDKVIILSGFSDKQASELIDHYRTNPNLPPNPIFAVATLRSKLMRLRELLIELKRERQSMQK